MGPQQIHLTPPPFFLFSFFKEGNLTYQVNYSAVCKFCKLEFRS